MTVVRRFVWSRNLVNEEPLAHGGLLPQIKKNGFFSIDILWKSATFF